MQTASDRSADAPRPVALVTGASAGIGLAFARLLAQRGHDLAIVARRRDRLDALAQELAAAHRVRVEAIPADLAEPEAPARVVAAALAAFGRIDVLVDNAGYGPRDGFASTPWEEHERFLRVMLTSYVELAHRVLPGMLARRSGRIVIVSSLASFAPEQRGSMYTPVKRFLTSWTRALALELRGTGVTATASCPGFTFSEFHDVMGNREHMRKLPGILWKSSEEVARRSWEAAERGEPVVIVGGVNKAIAALCTLLPTRAVHALAPRVLRERGDPQAFGK